MQALRTQGLLLTRDSLRAQGLPVTALALNRFRSWHHHRQTFQQFDDAGLLVAELAQRMKTAPHAILKTFADDLKLLTIGPGTEFGSLRSHYCRTLQFQAHRGFVQLGNVRTKEPV